MKSRTMILVSLATLVALVVSSGPAVRAADDADAVRLSLIECLGRALDNNLDLEIARRDPELAYQDVLFQKAQFDPLFRGAIDHRDSTSEPSQSFVAPSSKVDTLDIGFSGRLNFGATWRTALTGTRIDSNNQFNNYNPSWDSPLNLEFTLPLLQGLGKEVTTAALVTSRYNLDISHEALRGQATALLITVESAYWNLRAAREGQTVAEQTLQLSKDLYELNKKKVEVGTLAPIEITQAEANVASNVELTINAKQAVANAEDTLRRLLAIPKNDPMWFQTIIPTEEPVREQRPVNLDQAITTAMEERPEVIEARISLESSQLNERAARNLAKHKLDLAASVSPAGNNLIDPNAVPPTTGNWVDSLEEIPKFTNYEWRLGLSYEVPIGNRAAKANYAKAGLDRQKKEIGVQNAEEQVRVDVRTAARAVESGYERIVAARKNVELQQKKLEAEQKKFDNGMSTSFEVFTFQTDLRNAQLSLIQAMLDYNKALADLERAKGTLLESKGLKLADNAGR